MCLRPFGLYCSACLGILLVIYIYMTYIPIYLFIIILITCSFLLLTTVISYYYTKLGFALLHISVTYFS